MVYGLGAAVVIIGALCKILHIDLIPGVITGGMVLGFGLIVEACIFVVSAFEPVDKEYDWSLVYPELAGGESRGNQLGFNQKVAVKEVETQALKESLSEKLDGILKEAKVDADLMQSLAKSIRNFEGAAREIAPVADAMASTHKYGEELSLAAVHLESLNSLYKIQLERTEMQVNAQGGMVDNLNSLNAQVSSFKEHLKSLNSVYGGMLSAMGFNK
ncbi:gliding motility protein GldL [Capnocytophaga catalasegens]|uniref:Gliding motility protein GldL n=2 Tax=Capnocytophaga catalasegens TaxID=1004260 RepID=A0AAV5AUN4_9FLAO|nr:gliding motility protein GldL [Capnocytophaga catalasegens]GJM49157.1 gliding motility protein GldL [Capnocytophaga catalasegens]GJM53659.1 gliding motility protein GldL [Capnocytophaga catalasegens]